MASVVVNGIVSEGPGPEGVPETKPQSELVVGLPAAPGPASELTESLVGEIADRLAGQLPGVRWRAEFVSGRLVQPPTDLSELIAAGRRMLLERGWHLAVCVTDLPLQTARRPVIAHVSATHGVAVLSMPALGPVSVRKRTVETTVRLVGHILGDLAQAEGAAGRLPLAEAVTRRLRELGARTERGEHVGLHPHRHVQTNGITRMSPAHRIAGRRSALLTAHRSPRWARHRQSPAQHVSTCRTAAIKPTAEQIGEDAHLI